MKSQLQKILGTMAITLFFAMPVLGQSSTFSLQYSVGFGAGNTKEHTTSTSFRGGVLEYKAIIGESVGLGGDIGWNVFYERRPQATYTLGTVSVSGIQYRYIDFVPIFVTTDYYFSPNEKINPFVGMGLGTLYSNTRTEMGLYSLTMDGWQFAIKPTAGMRVDMGGDVDFLVSVRYIQSFETDDVIDQSYFSFNVGFVWK